MKIEQIENVIKIIVRFCTTSAPRDELPTF